MNDTPAPPPVEKEPGKPVASLVLGLIGLVACFIPIIGLPVTITGLVFGIKACRRVKNGMAIAGTILCSIGLVLSVMNFAWGAYLGATGQHPVVNRLTNRSPAQGQ
jgi:hypothetical protein